MGFIIHREKEHDRVITMGQASRVIVPPVIETPPPEPVKNKRGRTRKMEKDKEEMSSRSGVEVTREDDAGQQGAIGSHGEHASTEESGNRDKEEENA